MRRLSALALVTVLVTVLYSHVVASKEPWLNEAINVNNDISQSFDSMRNIIHSMGRQMMMQQFSSEERVRSEGNSGIKQIRNRNDGTQNYHSATHSGKAVAAIHEHANNIRTVGMGELEVVMNGVEFRTRHNDYRLYMPHETSKDYRMTQNVPFPEVPQAVLDKGDDVNAQLKEMREWFKAFRDQNSTVRDYRKHFKPTLCYMEGAWTKAEDNIEEPFHSDRHFIDAKTWFDLQRKNMFTAASGSKSRLENLAFLPTSIIDFVNETIPVFAQWNYRILCHPLKRDLPLNRLRVVEDLSTRMQNDKSIFKHLHSRAARFQVNPRDSNSWSERPSGYGLLDELMGEIPGMNNYQGNISGIDLDGNKMTNMDGTVKDMSKYHRWYRVDSKDAMGLQNVHRGFADSFMFAATTTQEKIAPVSTTRCKRRVCKTTTQRWTYAIPLEIIYLTPLSKWNPLKIKYKGDNRRSVEYKSVNEGGKRSGSCRNLDASKAYNGTNSKTYYMTPSEFYSGGEVNKDAADTSRSSVCVLDHKGVSRRCRSSGTRIFLPKIKDVGVLRQRYPIMPVHGEGSAVWKEVNAIRNYIMNPEAYGKFAWDAAMETTDSRTFELAPSTKGGSHIHEVVLTADEFRQLKGGVDVTTTTSLANSHQHELTLRWNERGGYVFYVSCGDTRACKDRHPYNLITVKVEENVTNA